MKYLLTIVILISVAYGIRQKREQVTLSDSSQTFFIEQQIQLANSSFSPLYMHVFEYKESGPVKHLNLTDQLKGTVLNIKSFELLEDQGASTWIAYLKKDKEDKIYVCEIEGAFKTQEIAVLKR